MIALKRFFKLKGPNILDKGGGKVVTYISTYLIYKKRLYLCFYINKEKRDDERTYHAGLYPRIKTQ